MNNWFDHILFQAQSQPEKPALVMEDRVVTYAMLRSGIEACAHQIAEQRLTAARPVAVVVGNPIRHLTLCLALFRIGIVSISLDQAQSGVDDLRLAAILVDRDASGLIAPGNRTIEVTDGWFSPRQTAGDLPPGFSDASQICRISLTSGATGAPKSIAHPISEFGRRLQPFMQINWNVALCLPGLSSNWGFITACAALATGRTLCFAQSSFQAVRMIDLMSIDFVTASTEQLVALTRVAAKSRAQVLSLRTIWSGGSVPTRPLLEAAMAYLCNNILCRYAASETGLIAQASARELLADPGLVGYPVPGVEVAILDGRGERCKVGKIGAIKVRIDEEPLAAARSGHNDQASWIDLGDTGWLDAEGRLHVVGRTADLRLSGASAAPNQGISPVHEIEHILRLGCDTTDLAAVMLGQDANEPRLWVGIVGNKDATAAALTALLRARGHDYALELFHIAAIPRGATGKVNREQLKVLMRASAEQAGRA